MKKQLFGRNNRPQQSLDISSPSYPQQSAHSPDPSRNPNQPIFRGEQPPQQQQQQPFQPLRQDDPQNVARQYSQRRTSQQQQLEQQLLQQQLAQQGQIPPNFVYAGQQGPPPPQFDDRQGELRNSAYLSTHPQQGPPPPQQQSQSQEGGEKKKLGFRERFGLGSHNKAEGQPRNHGAGLGRHSSVKIKNSPNPNKYTDDQKLYSTGNNSSILGTQDEDGEDSQHNQFVVQQRQLRAQKDLPDQFRQGQPQDYYPPPGTQSVQGPGGQFNPQQFIQPGQEVFLTPEQHQHLQHLQQQGHVVQFPGQPPVNLQQQFTHYPPPQGVISQPTDESTTAPQPPQVGQEPSTRVSSEESHSQHGQSPLPTPDQPNEILQPLATRPQQQGQPSAGEAGYLLAPGKSIVGPQNPPSPLPGQNQLDQITSQGPAQPPSPAGTQHSAPSPMPPPSRTGASIRQAGEKASREGMATGASGQPYRGPPPADNEGRASPPERGLADMTEDDVNHFMQLQKDHKELREKYTKVKKYYFEKESQVHQLQNTLANQRMSASRTSLDDSEYIARFERLSGLVSQLSFSIRKNWVKVPEWLHGSVNKDAIVTAKQEMTAVGKAFISRWLWQEVFQTVFHPDLELPLSLALKNIYTNIRHMSPPVHSAEEDEALSSKLSLWRMATLDGVATQLRSPIAAQNRNKLIGLLSERLVGDISPYLTDPVPSDLAGGVNMVVELAITIAAHLPVESREVQIEYFPPMSYVSPDVMKIETGIPPLTNPVALPEGYSPSDSASADENAERDSEEQNAPPAPPKDDAQGGARRRGGVLAFIAGGSTQPAPPAASKSGPGGGPGSIKGQGPGKGPNGASGRETPTPPTGPGNPPKEERVRMAIGLAVMIRGRSVLVKAPVYTAMV